MIRMTVWTCLLASVGAAFTQPVPLQPLETITWDITHTNEIGETPIPTAISLQARGKRVDKDYADIPVAEASYYVDPISCCVALITATFTANESWWGKFSATAADRDADGNPKAEYVPDSDSNWYRFATAYTVSEDFARPISARIINYIRIGRLHGVDVRWEEQMGEKTATYSHFIPFQEFTPGKFRYAPEWEGAFDPIIAIVGFTDTDAALGRQIRDANPGSVREVKLVRLFGEEDGEFPLTLLFSASSFSNSSRSEAIGSLRDTISKAASALPEDDASYLTSDARESLKKCMTPSSLAYLDEESAPWRKRTRLPAQIGVVIDGGSFLFLGRWEGEPQEIAKGFNKLYDDGGALKLSNLSTQTLLDNFLEDDRVWSVLGPALTAIAAE